MSEKQDPKSHQEGRVGVYVCYCGGNISDQVDVEKVCQQTGKVTGVALARSNMFMCSDPGQEMIIDDLKSGRVDRVVVASCSPSLHESTFRQAMVRAGVNPYVYEHANLREQVSWVHHGEEATAKATRLVAAAAAKAAELKPLQPIRVEVTPQAVIIGGGVSGLKTALELAERGLAAVIVEKSPFLGGRVAHLDHLAPTGEKAAAVVSTLVGAVLRHPSITVHTCSQVTGFEGYVGNFKVTVEKTPPVSPEDDEALGRACRSGRGVGEFIPFVGIIPEALPPFPEEVALEAGVVILATGFKTYQPRQGEYGFGEFSEVITLPELIRAMAADPGHGGSLEYQGRRIRRMAMVHCVGSRQIPGVHEENEGGYLNEYCSRTCCSATIYAANRIRERHPATRVIDFYRDIRTYGRGQEELYTQAAKNGVLFCRFEAGAEPQVTKNPESGKFPLLIKAQDVLTFGEEVEAAVDLVVLAVGQEANDISDLVEKMKIPVGADRFLQEVHPKLRPVELPAAGLLLAGNCQAPFNVGESCATASCAAVKAAAVLARGYVELDPFVAAVDAGKCQGTGACVAACLAEGALALVDLEVEGRKIRRAQVNPALCLGCGACVAACPENAINIQGWTLQQYEAMVDMIVSDHYLEGA